MVMLGADMNCVAGTEMLSTVPAVEATEAVADASEPPASTIEMLGAAANSVAGGVMLTMLPALAATEAVAEAVAVGVVDPPSAIAMLGVETNKVVGGVIDMMAPVVPSTTAVPVTETDAPSAPRPVKVTTGLV
jgi:hypothetical protein